MKARLKKISGFFSNVISQLIIFEIVFMTSPLALYFYFAYRPGLNFLNSNPFTSWLTSFFLPHYSHSSIQILNQVHEMGYWFFLPGLLLLLVSFIPLYLSKLRKTGAVTGGIYRIIRHPQYTSFALMGFGVLMVWPRTIVFLLYVLMLISYLRLAFKEEKECLAKFGVDYEKYRNKTSRFLPGDQKLDKYLERFSFKRPFEKVYVTLIVLVFSILIPGILKEISVHSLSYYTIDNSATISLTEMSKSKIREISEIALTSQEVGEILVENGYYDGTAFLNYIFPTEWNVPDLPFSFPDEKPRDHYHTQNYDKSRYRLLFTQARYHGSKKLSGLDIIKHSYSRKSLLVIDINTTTGEVKKVSGVALESLWGDVPTPLF